MMKGKQRKRFEVRRVRVDVDSLEWTWSLIAANGQFLAGPHESFKNRADCMKNLRLVRDTDVDTAVMEIPWVEPIAEKNPEPAWEEPPARSLDRSENQQKASSQAGDPPPGFGGLAGDRPKETPPAAPAA